MTETTTHSRSDNMGCPLYHYISIEQLDLAVIDWAEKFFDRAVLPSKSWMDPDIYAEVVGMAKQIRAAAGAGDLHEMKRVAQSVLARNVVEFARFEERRLAQVEVGLN